MISLSNKRVLVTGAASGIGKESCLLALELGAEVFAFVRDANEKRVTEGYLPSDRVFQADVSRSVEVAEAMAELRRSWANFDVLIHCAGVWRRAGLEETDDDIWNTCLDINLTGTFNICREAFPLLRQGGSAVLVSSHFSTQRGHAKATAYQASKAGIAGLTRSLAMEYASKNIRVNCVAPGPIDTPMTAPALANPDILPVLMAGVPLGRPGQAVEVARALIFLCSDWGSYITGQVLGVDGGSTAI